MSRVSRRVLLGLTVVVTLIATASLWLQVSRAQPSPLAKAPGGIRASAETVQAVAVLTREGLTIVRSDTADVVARLSMTKPGITTYFVAHPASQRLFVTYSPAPENEGADVLAAIRTSDWSTEFTMPVTDLVRYHGSSLMGLAVSPDGKTVYTYHYNDRTRGDAPPEYWIATLDVVTRSWQGKVMLPGCGPASLAPLTSERVAVFCFSDDGNKNTLRVADVAEGVVISSETVAASTLDRERSSYARVEAVAVSGSGFTAITDDAEVIGGELTANNQALEASDLRHERVSGDSSARELRVALPTTLQIDSHLLVPMSNPEESATGIASHIGLIDARSGRSLKRVETQPFRAIAFTSTGDAAATVPVDDRGYSYGANYVNLLTGETRPLLAEPASAKIIVFPLPLDGLFRGVID